MFLVRELGPEQFGVFSLALGLAVVLLLPADLGISQATARYVAEEHPRREAAAGALRDGLRLKLASAALLSALLFALADPIAAAYGTGELVWPLRGVALALFGQSVMMLFTNAFIALRRTPVNFAMVLSESAVETSASVALVLLGAGAGGAAFGRGIGYLFASALGLVLAVRLLGPRVAALRQSDRGRQIARYAGALFVVDTSFTVLAQLGVLLTGAYLTATDAGLLQAPMRLADALHYLGLALAAGIAPRLARQLERRRPAGVEAFATGIRMMIVCQAALIAPLLVWAEPITDLVLGSGYSDSADVLRLLAPFAFMSGLAPLISNGVDYLGEARRRIPIAVTAVAVTLTADLILIPAIGIEGAAIGIGLGYLIYVPWHVWLCDRLIGLPLGALALSLARSLAAAGAMAAVLLLIGSEPSAAGWLAGVFGGTAAFLAVLVATRELTAARLRSTWEILGRS